MRKHLLNGIALGALVLPGSMFVNVSTAEACNCFGVQNIVRSAHRDTVRNVNNHTTETGNYIVDTIVENMKLSTQQLSAYEERSAEANKRVEEGAQANEVIRQKQRYRAEAEGGRYDPAASACTDLSGIMGMGGGATAEGFGGNDIANVSRNRSRGNESEEVRLGGLAIAQGIINDRDELQNVGGVLDPTSDVRLLTENITLDTSNEDVAKAYARLVNNIVDPTPPRPITESELRTPQGFAAVAARQIDDARRSPAHAVFAHVGDMIAPTGGDELTDWAKKAVTEAYPNEVGDKVSTMQAIDIFVQSRFANPVWHQELAKMSPAAVMRETALTNALNLHVNWMRYQLEMTTATVDATQLAVDLDARDSRDTTSRVTDAVGDAVPAAPAIMNISSSGV